MSRRFALLGKSLSHSFSQAYFQAKFQKENLEAEYLNLELNSLHNLRQVIEDHEIEGFNITIPYKQEVLAAVDVQSNAVQEINACNCVVIRNGKWIAHNTDYVAFYESLSKLPNFNKALVLGDGGASKAVQFALKKKAIPFDVVSRKRSAMHLNYEDLSQLSSDYELLVNTTPLGTSPNLDEIPPIPETILEHCICVYDLIYNPKETALLKLAKANSCIVKNGEEMLVLQAEKSWDIWNNELEGL